MPEIICWQAKLSASGRQKELPNNLSSRESEEVSGPRHAQSKDSLTAAAPLLIPEIPIAPAM